MTIPIPVDTMPLAELIGQLTLVQKKKVKKEMRDALKVYGAAAQSSLSKAERREILIKLTRMVAGHLVLKSQAAKAA